jgi:hypothetical protein
MNDDNGELPSFGLGGPIDASRAQKQKEQEIERRTRHMLAQALSNWRKTKRGRPKAQWRENLLPTIARTMDSHPDESDTTRARILSEKMRPKVDIRTVQKLAFHNSKDPLAFGFVCSIGENAGFG